jgi:hypothetical protein
MDVVSALVAYLQAPEAVHPQQGSFHHPYPPGYSLESMPRHAIRGVMLLFLKASRSRGKS